jgi:hypothetical protein
LPGLVFVGHGSAQTAALAQLFEQVLRAASADDVVEDAEWPAEQPASALLSTGCEVYGVARGSHTGVAGVHPIAADLHDLESLRSALVGVDPTYVIITVWLRAAAAGRDRSLFRVYSLAEEVEHG